MSSICRKTPFDDDETHIQSQALVGCAFRQFEEAHQTLNRIISIDRIGMEIEL